MTPASAPYRPGVEHSSIGLRLEERPLAVVIVWRKTNYRRLIVWLFLNQ